MVEETFFINDAEDFEDNLVYVVTLPTPSTTAEWKAIVKEPSKFVEATRQGCGGGMAQAEC